MRRLFFLLLGGLLLTAVVSQAAAQQPSAADLSGGITVRANYQPFEKGFMIWRPDSGEIWTYYGSTTGTVTTYASVFYGLLPDNPVRTKTPAGRVRPIMGFGKVWGNVSVVRNGLGWATGPEQGYPMRVKPVLGYPMYAFTLPDGRVVSTAKGQWWIGDNAPSLNATPTVTNIPSTFQSFERGFMMWRGDTGTIWVLVNDGQAWPFPSQSYGALPFNPVTAPIPNGRVKPLMGFGQVWGNFANVQAALGWAVSSERSYTAPISSVYNTPLGGYFYLGFPDNRRAQIFSNGTWHFDDGTLPPYVGAPQPTATPPIVATAGPVTTSVQGAYQAFQNGFMVWTKGGGVLVFNQNSGQVYGYPETNLQALPDNPVTDMPPAGFIKPVNAFGRVWGSNAAIQTDLGWAVGSEQGYSVTRMDNADHSFSVSLPNGHVAYIYGGLWRWAA
jgi:hypothetical protein